MRWLADILGHLFGFLVVGIFGLLFFLIYKYHNVFLPIFGLFVLILIIAGIISEFNIYKSLKKKKPKKKFRDFIESLPEYFSNFIFIIIFGFILSGGAIVLVPGGIYKFFDNLYETENEIQEKWTGAYTPIISWCGVNNNNITSITGDGLKCLQDPNYRTELFNNRQSLAKKNEELALAKKNEELKYLFNKIPENLRNFKLNIENEDQLKKDTEVVKLNGGYIVHKNLEDYLLFKKLGTDEDDKMQYFCAVKKMSWCSYDFIKYSPSAVYYLGFLTDKQFFQLFKGCINGCKAEIFYTTEGNKKYVRGFNLLNYFEYKWSTYENKDSKEVKNYDEMILDTKNAINELKKKYTPPKWTSKINL